MYFSNRMSQKVCTGKTFTASPFLLFQNLSVTSNSSASLQFEEDGLSDDELPVNVSYLLLGNAEVDMKAFAFGC